MATKLVTIKPLSQSRYEDMGCESAYVLKHIEGVRTDNPASRRGTEVHKILRTYVDHLCLTRKRSDYGYFQALLSTASEDAQEAVGKFSDGYVCDFENIYGTEVHIALDGDFNPTEDPAATAFECTIDLISLPSATTATIVDYKSFWQVIDPDTFQGKFYPMMLMCLNPAIDEVEFVLQFVRYGAARSVTYTREDLPRLMKLAETERIRQVGIHLANEQEDHVPSAQPGKHCVFCPKLATSCPAMKTNPYSEMSPQGRVAFAMWLKEATKENDRILKDWLIDGGPIGYEDANSVEYQARFVKQDRRSYPLGKTFNILAEWFEAHPADRDLKDKLTVSGLSSPLKAMKRAALKTEMQAVARVNTITKLVVGRPDDPEDEDE